jgi:hypothetical protein
VCPFGDDFFCLHRAVCILKLDFLIYAKIWAEYFIFKGTQLERAKNKSWHDSFYLGKQ